MLASLRHLFPINKWASDAFERTSASHPQLAKAAGIHTYASSRLKKLESDTSS